jgi:hypothetical protein
LQRHRQPRRHSALRIDARDCDASPRQEIVSAPCELLEHDRTSADLKHTGLDLELVIEPRRL